MIVSAVNQPFNYHFYSINGPFSTNTSFIIMKDGVVITGVNPTITTITGTSNMYYLSYTPTATGRYSIRSVDGLVVQFDVVTKLPLDILSNLEDESLGSWQWNKQTGILTLVRQNGAALASFLVTDSLTAASRERQ